MTIIRITNHSSSLVFQAIEKMVGDHGFTYNADLSDTEVGKLDKEFKINFSQVDNTSRSNFANLRVRATVEVLIFHNAEGKTKEAQLRALDDIENLVLELERFSPSGKFSEVKQIVTVTDLVRWITEPVKQGDDSRLRTVILYEIEYKIRNPIVQGA